MESSKSKREGILLAEKLELLAARLRKCRKKDQNFVSMQDLAAALDASLKDTDDSGVLPSSTYVAPNSGSGWRATAAAMMPGIKRKKGPAGDKAYGGGASSGGKAPKRRKEARTDTLPVNVPYATPISVQQASSTHSFRTNSATTQDSSPNIHPHPQMVTPVPHYYLHHAPYMSASQYYPPYFYPPSQM
ncbi:hypothetical protein DFH08DRAFT_906697 [Mycena albidolilacea]|uniref:Uncharacterized protein n=1 Tax=Mycena albidolilacea TaxID=1033008 RepID=A0AAD6YYG9_9AGAR|nr:hypothetical protein DFH08DRAFT_906697 [Mycena albidolilacea]